MTVAETSESTELRLWPGVAPGWDDMTQQEESFADDQGRRMLRNVTVPSLTPYLPDPSAANGTGMIIAPGGGFFMLSWENEGTAVAEWLRDRGVACFVLKYRLTDTGPTQDDLLAFAAGLIARAGPEAELGRRLAADLEPALVAGAGADGVRAMELVRTRAAEWGIKPDRIGMMGFSAGGFLSTYVAAEAPPDARPDFIAPIYGADARGGVRADAPPLFTLVAADDNLCLSGCVDTFQQWRAAGRPAELHVYAQGGHGFGMAKRGLPIDGWIERLADWMAAQDLLPAEGA